MEKRTNLDKILYIMDRLGPDEILAQLAEEASELAQAALKYRRALDGKNPTPVSTQDALKHLEEEWGDVSIAYAALMIPAVVRSGNEVPFSALNMPVEMQQKLNRWVARLEETEG